MSTSLSPNQEKHLAFVARRMANMRAWGVEADQKTSARTRAEQAEVEAQVIPEAPLVHRQVIEAAPTYDECLACQ